MAVPLASNTTCDIYRNGVMPPFSPPSVAGVPCYLKPDWRGGQEAGDRPASGALTWTHIMLVDAGVDVRDSYVGQENQAAQDTVYIPDQNGTRFLVVFVERVQRGSGHEHKRVYLDRQLPSWPTNEL
jgi:hypothetical protein